MENVSVTVLMPSYHEEKYIAAAIESLVDDYVRENAEILVIDGDSNDETLAIVNKYIKKGYPVKLIQNEDRYQCYALNLGIREARGRYIVRVDAHSTYPEGYVRKLVELLESTGAANVGGVMYPKGNSPVQEAVALAMQHPVGVGNAKFHLGDYKGYVDTVYLGAFRKEIFQTVGEYDINCRTNEDAELNIRILKTGGKIYLDSSIRVEYRPRDTFGKLARQYFMYGRGRAYTTLKHHCITSLRQLAAPALVFGLLGSFLMGWVHPGFFLPWLLYIFSIFAVAFFTFRGRDIPFRTRLRMGIAFMFMHVPWGAGFFSFFFYRPEGRP